MQNCNFSGADLSGADFENADCTGCDFRDAKLRQARFPERYYGTLNNKGPDESKILQMF
ncbi:hypothetical protein ALO_11269 [Acetonema longum DSM 6540]|uniref:Pentapeptide repeat-containing protein n=1 Tax=Acetonema longum DSM 6540 TaxID=1009370 RepID=F7NJJ8_9FIRM|nr:hypothetical protein ALO_11269 [Acetonema longum DSM 6540]